ncbi:hypothetical protein C4K40_2937 [Pseudomonas sp. CMR5c]|nr:hypothetical protein C4K40_2937 [Pseudomonas sp. CMR5c]
MLSTMMLATVVGEPVVALIDQYSGWRASFWPWVMMRPCAWW